MYGIGKLVDNMRKLDRVLVADFDVVHHDGACGRVNIIADIVEPDSERVDILAVEGRDERCVQFSRYIVGDLVAFMLDALDLL